MISNRVQDFSDLPKDLKSDLRDPGCERASDDFRQILPAHRSFAPPLTTSVLHTASAYVDAGQKKAPIICGKAQIVQTRVERCNTEGHCLKRDEFQASLWECGLARLQRPSSNAPHRNTPGCLGLSIVLRRQYHIAPCLCFRRVLTSLLKF